VYITGILICTERKSRDRFSFIRDFDPNKKAQHGNRACSSGGASGDYMDNYFLINFEGI
jgi:hypothetical protein